MELLVTRALRFNKVYEQHMLAANAKYYLLKM